jgi:hypothetical protein
MSITIPNYSRASNSRASTRYARSDPRAATAALGGGKTHGPSLGGSIMYHTISGEKLSGNPNAAFRCPVSTVLKCVLS